MEEMVSINTKPEPEMAMEKKNPTAIDGVVLGKGNTTTCCNKTRQASVIPAKRRLVKKMMFESTVQSVASAKND
ncbi:unnamed protein product [Prunus armeniaca]|uniref:Uncharacterized protein n=1 Tax=Prunus armeniaca TaxID=36596 RepID=A0A6J5TUZ2_PRUAR|nr:unnamed protein product [Prunus armeniaca]